MTVSVQFAYISLQDWAGQTSRFKFSGFEFSSWSSFERFSRDSEKHLE